MSGFLTGDYLCQLVWLALRNNVNYMATGCYKYPSEHSPFKKRPKQGDNHPQQGTLGFDP